jgi:hypothetical protein
MENFSVWLEKKAIVYIDLDDTLISSHDNKVEKRPKVDKFISDLKKIADVKIISHNHLAKNKEYLVGINLPTKIPPYKVKKDKNSILIDNLPPENKLTKDKMKAIGIDADRVITPKKYFGGKKDDGELDLVFHRVKDILSPTPVKQTFKSYVKARDMAEDRKKDFKNILEKIASKVSGSKIYTDIKNKKSFSDKLINKNKEPDQINDVLRGAIIVDNKNDIEKVVDEIKFNFVVKKIDKKTKPEFFGYYGATHIDVVLNGMICEIQIMTKKLWKAKLNIDEIYHNYRYKKEIPLSLLKKSRKSFKDAND